MVYHWWQLRAGYGWLVCWTWHVCCSAPLTTTPTPPYAPAWAPAPSIPLPLPLPLVVVVVVEEESHQYLVLPYLHHHHHHTTTSSLHQLMGVSVEVSLWAPIARIKELVCHYAQSMVWCRV